MKLTKNGDLPVPQTLIETLVRAANAAGVRECCGLLVGRGGELSDAIETRNVHPSPETHFEIDPQPLIGAHRAERGGGPALMGYFHSHPAGDPRPSRTDRAMASRDGRIWAIVAGGDVMFWQDDEDGFRALSYEVVSG
ncbi:Mov34/MPN/PAD-1 family protein [Erythrobacter sp. MTPC3]|uniref:Mov34/MPN/PAD-1 family protein n=1 Tax=Erythrobacter sp. MTPC3 TaxID=3056564 RepID=UPI0036F2CFD7